MSGRLGCVPPALSPYTPLPCLTAERRAASTVAALSLSVVSSVSLVIVNKYLISTLGFPYVTTLTAAHLVVTALGLELATRLHLFDAKPMDNKPRVQFAIINAVSIGFLNLSLAFNSVGFYQMTKLAIIPATVTLQTLFYAKTFTTRVKLALLVLLLGVAVAQVNDVELNALGCVVSVCAVVTTCVSQIWTGSMQKQHGVTSTQLLHNASPVMAATLLVIGVPVDAALMSPEASALFTFSVPSIFFTLLSCLIAVSVNFSTFLVIGKCDAVTYQVLGHLKTVLILVLGFVALKNPANPRAIGGIVIAMVGMVAYAHEEQRAQAAAQSGAAQEKAAALDKAVLGVEGAGAGAGSNGDAGTALHARDSSGGDLELKARGTTRGDAGA